MSKIFILIILLIPFSICAKNLTCSKNGTAVLYVNGIDNSKDDAFEAAEKVKDLSELFKANLDKDNSGNSALFHGYQYNRTEGLGLDIIESAAQKIRSYLPNVLNPYKVWSQYLRIGTLPSSLSNSEVLEALAIDLENVRQDVLNLPIVAQDTILLAQRLGGYLANDRKVLLVSHSQGNLFANEAFNVLKNGISSEKLKFYKNLMVATPANYNATNGPWMTLDSDKVIKLVGLPSNYAAKDSEELKKFKQKDSLVHNFLKIYATSSLKGALTSASFEFPFVETGSMEEILTGNLIETAKLLESNCSGLPTFTGNFITSNVIIPGLGNNQKTSAIDNDLNTYYQLGDTNQFGSKLYQLSSLNGIVKKVDYITMPAGYYPPHRLEVGSDGLLCGLASMNTANGPQVSFFSIDPSSTTSNCICDKPPVIQCDENDCYQVLAECLPEEKVCNLALNLSSVPVAKKLNEILYVKEKNVMVGMGKNNFGNDIFVEIDPITKISKSTPINIGLEALSLHEEWQFSNLQLRSDGKLVGVAYYFPFHGEGPVNPGTEQLPVSRIFELNFNEDATSMNLKVIRDITGSWARYNFDGPITTPLIKDDLLHMFSFDYYPLDGDFWRTPHFISVDTACINGLIVTKDGQGQECRSNEYLSPGEHGAYMAVNFSYHFNSNNDIVGFIRNGNGSSFFMLEKNRVRPPLLP